MWIQVLCVGAAVSLLSLPAAPQTVGAIPILRESLKEVPGIGSGPALTSTDNECDEAGGVYYRGYTLTATGESPVVRLEEDGSRYTIYDLSNDNREQPKVSHSILDFSASGGMVYILASVTPVKGSAKSEVFLFEQKGRYRGSVELDVLFNDGKIAVFPGGEIIVAGSTIEAPTPGEGPRLKPAIILFDRRGRLVREVILSQPADLNPVTGSSAAPTGLLEEGVAEVFFIPPGPSVVLHAISAAGEVSRSLQLEPPGDGFRPIHLYPGPTQVLVGYTLDVTGEEIALFLHVVYDLFTGERRLAYRESREVGGAFACYDWRGGFTFVTSYLGKRALVFGRGR